MLLCLFEKFLLNLFKKLYLLGMIFKILVKRMYLFCVIWVFKILNIKFCCLNFWGFFILSLLVIFKSFLVG